MTLEQQLQKEVAESLENLDILVYPFLGKMLPNINANQRAAIVNAIAEMAINHRCSTAEAVAHYETELSD
jgi:hypothetical protein